VAGEELTMRQKKKISELREELQELVRHCGNCPIVEQDEEETEVGSDEDPEDQFKAGDMPDVDGEEEPAEGEEGEEPPPEGEEPPPEGEEAPPDGEQPPPEEGGEEGHHLPIAGHETDFAAAHQGELEVQKKCVCAKCPSNPRGAQAVTPKELGYCNMGESNMQPIIYKGCLCPSCPVYKENGYIGWYFCATGRAETVSEPTMDQMVPGTEPEEHGPEGGNEPPPEEEEPAPTAGEEEGQGGEEGEGSAQEKEPPPGTAR
jgi:Protein of unknown function (DUF2769)